MYEFLVVRNRFLVALLGYAVALGATMAVARGASHDPSPTQQVTDPGVRPGPDIGAAPAPLNGLTTDEQTFFQDGLTRFQQVETVTGGANTGLGPTFNSNECGSCHSFPFIGGSSPPANNPQVAVGHADGATNQIPWFITLNGPVREARFQTDGGVHDVFVITGRADAGACSIAQPNFGQPGNPITGQGGNSNVVFRIPTPLMGAGLIENIPDSTILANQQANAGEKQALGIAGSPNISGNDGTITRFGWKAQNKSLLMFAGEAYNVEIGISNQLFPQERNETENCSGGNSTPNDTVNFSSAGAAVLSDIEAFADFMRMLAPPIPATPTQETQEGGQEFANIGCAMCHTPTMTTGTAIASGSATNPSVALSNQQAQLYSDLLLHHMGIGLADGISQGFAGGDQFRTAPLWGVGQRAFFLHDGRTNNLITAIEDHSSSGSEANTVINNYNALSPEQQQALIDFLRSL
jgi:CxxC motif-containing protein (DUF1111 family)